MNTFTHKATEPVTIFNYCSWCTAWNGTNVISSVLSLDHRLSQTNTSYYHSVYCFLTRYILVRIHTAKCFTNSSKGFRSEEIFEDEHMFCSLIHHVRTCTTFATGVSSGLATSDLDSSLRGEASRVLHGDGPICHFVFVPFYVIVIGLRFKWYILYIWIFKTLSSNLHLCNQPSSFHCGLQT
jgi:hypothetical protein